MAPIQALACIGAAFLLRLSKLAGPVEMACLCCSAHLRVPGEAARVLVSASSPLPLAELCSSGVIFDVFFVVTGVTPVSQSMRSNRYMATAGMYSSVTSTTEPICEGKKSRSRSFTMTSVTGSCSRPSRPAAVLMRATMRPKLR